MGVMDGMDVMDGWMENIENKYFHGKYGLIYGPGSCFHEENAPGNENIKNNNQIQLFQFLLIFCKILMIFSGILPKCAKCCKMCCNLVRREVFSVQQHPCTI